MENKLQYYTRILKGASFAKLQDALDNAHRRSGKSKLALFFDLTSATRRYGAGYNDYVIFEFWNLTAAQRDTYLTRLRNKKLINQMNDEAYSHCFDNKNEFDKIFAAYVKRDFVDMTTAGEEEVTAYFNRHERVFAKMLDLDKGRGAELLKTADFASAADFYKYVKEKNFGVLEEVLVNHPEVAKIYPHALNTMRIITLIGDDGKPYILFAAQKFGDAGRFVDIFGMHSPIDLDSGEVKYPFHSGDTTTDVFYSEHPYTGMPLTGFKVPLWDETKQMMLAAAMEVPQLRYVGWDVAVTTKGPVIVEGNNYSAYEYMQLPGQTDDRIGIIPRIKEIAPSYQYK